MRIRQIRAKGGRNAMDKTLVESPAPASHGGSHFYLSARDADRRVFAVRITAAEFLDMFGAVTAGYLKETIPDPKEAGTLLRLMYKAFGKHADATRGKG